MAPIIRVKKSGGNQQQTANPSATSSNNSANRKPDRTKKSSRTEQQKRSRNAKDAAALVVVNGVTSASKVQLGQTPKQGRWQDGAAMIYRCAICDRGFKEKHHVKSHMAACVGRNGNPDGARWDDACNHQAPPVAPQASDQDTDSDATVSETDGADERRSLSDSVPSSRPELESSPSATLSPYAHPSSSATTDGASLSFETLSRDRQHAPSTLGRFAAFDPDVRMDNLTTRALLHMAQAWDAFQPVLRLYYQRLTGELRQRGIVDAEGMFVVDLEELDLGARRVVVDDDMA